MGGGKAWLDVGGRAMISRVIDALSPVCANLAIIANSTEYERLGLPVFSDSSIGIGPLEAIRTAMANARTAHVIVAACDLPFVTSELFAFLLKVDGDWEAIVPLDCDGRMEPLCAVYSSESLGCVTELIEHGHRRIGSLLERVRTRLVTFDEVRVLDGAESFFENVNTPEDYSRVIERLAGGGQAPGDRG